MHSANIGNDIFILIIPAIMTMELKHIFSPATSYMNLIDLFTRQIYYCRNIKIKKSNTRNA